jgi:hypothetical protein
MGNISRFFPFLRRAPLRESVPLELISIHIPKTAGTSFHHILAQQYGECHVERIDWPKLGDEICRNPSTAVVHGHLSYKEAKLLDPSGSIPRITWIRNPIDRVVSNYNYLSEKLVQLIDEPRHGVDILSKLQRSLLEFASAEKNRNRIHKFLEGSSIEDYAFIGVVERYDEDINALQRHFGWQNVNPVYYNSSNRARSKDVEIRSIIEELNQEDLRWYREVLKFRGISV